MGNCGIVGYQSSFENTLSRIDVEESTHFLSQKKDFLLLLKKQKFHFYRHPGLKQRRGNLFPRNSDGF